MQHKRLQGLCTKKIEVVVASALDDMSAESKKSNNDDEK